MKKSKLATDTKKLYKAIQHKRKIKPEYEYINVNGKVFKREELDKTIKDLNKKIDDRLIRLVGDK